MYPEKYGLEKAPFENTPDPSFLFPSISHREVLASLHYGVENAKGFVLVSGDIGTGKTTLIRAFLMERKSSDIILNIVYPKWVFNELIMFLAQNLGISTEGDIQLTILENIKQKLDALDRKGRRLVIIIDEAHLLSIELLEEIRLLSNIENNNRKLIQIILVGQNEIHNKLKADSLKTFRQRIVINRQIKPLSNQEIKDYINHRLRVAGANSEFFSKGAIGKICKISGGIPRIINKICDNALLIGYATDVRRIGSSIIDEVSKDMDQGFSSPRKQYFPKNISQFAGLTLSGITIIFIIFYLWNINNNQPAIQKPIAILESTEKKLPSIGKNENSKEKLIIADIAGDKLKELDTKNDVVPDSDLRDDKKAIYTNSEKYINRVMNGDDLPESSKAGDDDSIAKVEMQSANIQKLTPVDEDVIKLADSTEILVRPNNYLIMIAKKEYGEANDTIIDLIHMVNPTIKDVNKIYVGQIVYLPNIRKNDLIVHSGEGMYHIHYASFYNFAQARIYMNQLNSSQKEAFIVPATQNDTQVYRVYAGIYQDRKKAEKAVNSINFEYLKFLN